MFTAQEPVQSPPDAAAGTVRGVPEVPTGSVARLSEAGDQWVKFGFTATTSPREYVVPAAVVAFETVDEPGRAKLVRLLADMGVPPRLFVKGTSARQTVYRLGTGDLADTLAGRIPEGVTFYAPGDCITLPSPGEWQPDEGVAVNVGDLSVLTAEDVARGGNPGTASTGMSLRRHSLRGQSAAFREQAVEASPLLGDICLNGQVTVWYAAPNAGKTLIALSLLIEAVRAGRIAGENAYYVNADDGSDGMATKLELMDDIGVHTLAPGFGDFRAADLVSKLVEMAEKDDARGVFVLIDTTKKFTSLMDKKQATAFGQACRQVAMRGGAILNLAHINKLPKADGTPQFAGTTDLVDDTDAAYMLASLDLASSTGEKVVEFKCFKRRGNNADTAAYAYAAEDGVGYVERLSSVRRVDTAALEEFKRVEVQKSDEEVIAVVASCIADGHDTKMMLGKEAALRAGTTGRAAYRIVDRYTGDDPVQHRWRFSVKERGAKVFELLPPPPS